MKLNNKSATIVIVILVALIAILGGTLAGWLWQTSSSQKTNVTFTVTADFSCSADGGGDITSSDVMLAPSTCNDSNYAIKRQVKVSTTQTSGKAVLLDMWLKINDIGTNLAASENFRYALTTNSSSCSTDVVSTGTFAGANTTTNSEFLLLDGSKYLQTTSDDTYYLYIWLDEAETSVSMASETFSMSLQGSCTDELSHVNAPVLDAGMIPVKIANDGTVTAVSKNDSSWYDYDNREWANAVLTTSTNRSTYQAIANGTNASATIPSNEILAYYVWIPRYSYKLWITSGISTTPRTIGIKWISKESKDNGAVAGEYYTHPAFTFGDEELPGFWVGKFETTGDATTPTIIPNANALMNQTGKDQFTTNLKFAGGTFSESNGTVAFSGSNTYGLSDAADSHMMKTVEWGAVAYLSNTKYGINGKIRINNNTNAKTGCGASTAGGAKTSACQITYGSSVAYYPQSNTGNITGVFDMSGCGTERVMGNYNGVKGQSAFDVYPPSKYYNNYTSNVFTGDWSTNMALCTLATCGGHALNETRWYYQGKDEYVEDFVDSDYPWFIIGGFWDSKDTASQYAITDTYGGARYNVSSRNVLVS